MKRRARLANIISLILGILFLALTFSFSPFFKSTSEPFVLNISHFVGNIPLKLDSVVYKNKIEQNFTITKFKYYIGQIVLKQENGKLFRSENYFLVNEEVETSKNILLENVPPGNYTSLEFIIGVDSLHNCSGAQSGALDPINTMYWAWNSGYIFLKLEGVSPISKSPAHLFEYHIGGFKQPSNCIRKITLDLRKTETQKTKSIFLKVDLMKLLEGQTNIDFGKLSSVTDARNATVLADNYKNMFSVRENENKK